MYTAIPFDRAIGKPVLTTVLDPMRDPLCSLSLNPTVLMGDNYYIHQDLPHLQPTDMLLSGLVTPSCYHR